MADAGNKGSEDYSTWTWQQIKQAIVGGVDISTKQEGNSRAQISDPTTFIESGVHFDTAFGALEQARQNLSDEVSSILGSSWQGEAADALNTVMQKLLKGIDDYITPITNGGYRNPLGAAANQLANTISAIEAADRKAAQDTVNKFTSSPQGRSQGAPPWRDTGDGSSIVDVSRYPEIEKELTESLRAAIQQLANTYQTSGTDMKEPIQHAFVEGGKVVDTPDTASIDDKSTADGTDSKTTVFRKPATAVDNSDNASDKASAKTDNGSGKTDNSSDGSSDKTGKSSTSDNPPPPADNQGSDNGDHFYEPPPSSSDNSSFSHSGNGPHLNSLVASGSKSPPPSPDFSQSGDNSQFDTSDDDTGNDDTSSHGFLFSPHTPPTPNFGNSSTGANYKKPTFDTPNLGNGATGANYKTPTFDKPDFAPDTHLEGLNSNGLLAPPNFNSSQPHFGSPPPIGSPHFGDEDYFVQTGESNDGLFHEPIGSSLVNKDGATLKTLDFRSGNPPPPPAAGPAARGLTNLTSAGVGRPHFGGDGYAYAGSGASPGHGPGGFGEGEGYSSGESPSSFHGSGPGGGYGTAAAEGHGSPGAMPFGGMPGGRPQDEDERHRRGNNGLLEDEDVWENENKKRERIERDRPGR